MDSPGEHVGDEKFGGPGLSQYRCSLVGGDRRLLQRKTVQEEGQREKDTCRRKDSVVC